MIVYIDGMDFRRTGIGRVYESILAGLVEREEIRGVQTLVPRDRGKEFGDSYGGQAKIDAAFTDFPPFSPGDFLRKQREIVRARNIPVSAFRALLRRNTMPAAEIALKD